MGRTIKNVLPKKKNVLPFKFQYNRLGVRLIWVRNEKNFKLLWKGRERGSKDIQYIKPSKSDD